MKKVPVTLPLVLKVYKAFGEPGGFLTFFNNWKSCDVFEIPSGYIRFEHHPPNRTALIHGIFFGNPFRDSEIILSMIQLYIESKEGVDAVECIVPTGDRGVNKLCRSIHKRHKISGNYTIYY